jgi:asparagine N-glycosylation enzyme membrane subunit Stt3
MNKKIQKSILAGIIGTIAMTLLMMAAPMMGMPKMSPPEMLSGMLGLPIFIGWLMHFMIGIAFAFAYTYLFVLIKKLNNVYLKGIVFGVMVFVFAQIMIAIMGAILPMPDIQGSPLLITIGSLMGHIVFGIGVSKTAGADY